MSKVKYWAVKQRWWLISLLAILLLALEYLDTIRQEFSFIHTLELLIYLILLIIIGSLLDSLLQVLKVRTKYINLIDYKHKLSMEFSTYNDWGMLVTQMVRFPGTIARVYKTSLFVFDSHAGQFELAARWPNTIDHLSDAHTLEMLQKRLHDGSEESLTFQQFELEQTNADARSRSYRLPLLYGKSIIGEIQFHLIPGEVLTREQEHIFKNVGDEFALVLKVGQERRKFYEMTMSETTIAERRRVSRFIHDHLGHNLGYLHLKLDQLVSQINKGSHETIENDLEHLRSAAYESYEFVRGTLETLHKQTTPQLTNQLSEYAQKIARRADFKIEFMTIGKPVALPVEVNQAIFYAFEEALSNIEKYARASKVDVCVEWGAEGVELRISDDGIGFDVDKVNTDRHFGLGILHERMEKVFGQVTLNTSENSGTVVSIRVPNSPAHRLGASL